VKAVSNTSTVTLQVVGGDEKGSLKTETVKFGDESEWREPASYTKDRSVLSSARVPQKKKSVTVKW
jgi:hypothetical protein